MEEIQKKREHVIWIGDRIIACLLTKFNIYQKMCTHTRPYYERIHYLSQNHVMKTERHYSKCTHMINHFNEKKTH